MSQKVFVRPRALTDVATHYCPGCQHGIVHRLIAEVIDELDIQRKTIGVVPVGCSVLADQYFNVDCQQAAHGRAPARRLLPELSGCIRTKWYSLIKAMVTLPRSGPQKSFMRQPAAKKSRQFLSIMPFMA